MPATAIQFLSVIDALVNQHQTGPRSVQRINRLEELLRIGNSAWAGRARPEESHQPCRPKSRRGSRAGDRAASDELAEAWQAAYGREPNPSDAWDHSIKAVEHIIKPVICPNNTKATLSNVTGDLRFQP